MRNRICFCCWLHKIVTWPRISPLSLKQWQTATPTLDQMKPERLIPPPMWILWTLNWTPPPSFFTGPPHAVTPRWIDSNVLNALNTSLWGSLPPPCRLFCHNILQQFSATLKHNWLLSQFYATSTPTAWAEELLGSGEDLQKCSLICRNSNNWIMVIL